MTAPLMVLCIPLLDTTLSILRRYLTGKPIFGADRGHIHHKLLARGFTPRRVVLVIYGVCGVAACLSLLQSVFQQQYGGLIVVVFCAGLILGVQRLGYAEFEVAQRIILASGFRKTLKAELQLLQARDDLSAANTPAECWEVLRRVYPEFGFTQVQFRLGEQRFEHSSANGRESTAWAVRVRLSGSDYVRFSCALGGESSPVLAGFVDAIAKGLMPVSRSARDQMNSDCDDPARVLSLRSTKRDADGKANTLSQAAS